MVNPRFVIKAVISGQRLNINVPLTVSGTVNYIGVEAKCTSEWDGCTIVGYVLQPSTGFYAQMALIYDQEKDLYYFPNAERLVLSAGEWTIWFVGIVAESGQEKYRVTTETRVFTVYANEFEKRLPQGNITLDEEAIARATDAQNKANLVLDLYNKGKLTGPKGDPGDPAEIGFVQASVDNTTDNPSCEVTVTESPDNTYNMQFAFSGIKGAKGDTGATGPKGDTGAQGAPGRDGTDGRDGVDGETIDDYVLVQAEQPTSETNKMWLKPTASAQPVMIPTVEEVTGLKNAIAYQELPFVIPTKRYSFDESNYHISLSQNVRCSKMYAASGESIELSFSGIPICRILCFDANFNFLGRRDMSSNTPTSFFTNTKYVMLKVAVTGSGNVADDAWSNAHPVTVKSGIAPKLINDNTIVAPYNTTEDKKMRADYVGNGTDDRRCLHIAINVSYFWGEKTILLEGDYVLNSLADGNGGESSTSKNKVCLYTGVSTPNTQFETNENFYQIEGEVMPFAYKKGVIIHLGETLYNSLANDVNLSLLRGFKINGAVPNGNRVGALSVKNIIFRLPGNQKKVTCLDFNYSHSAICEHVNCIAVNPDEGYGYISPTNIKAPPVPVEGCNGILGTFGSCWNTNTVFRNIECIGFYVGFDVSGEHMLVENASMKYNWYGFTFSHCQKLSGNPRHPIVCLNLLDEHNFNMPLFDRTADQPIYIIGLNLMYASIVTFEGHSGEDFDRSEHNRAVDVGGQTRGFVYYNNVTPKDGLFGTNQVFPAFFQTPNQGMKCVNSRHRLAAPSQDIQAWEANYMQEVFDTTLNKKLIYNGTNWVDMNGLVAY